MTISTPAFYFSGHTSRPENVVLQVSPDERYLEILSEDLIRERWELRILSIESAGFKSILNSRIQKGKTLEFENPDFLKALQEVQNKKGHTGIYSRLMQGNAFYHLLFAAAIIAVLAASYFLAVPWLAERAVSLLPETYDDRLGNLVSKDLLEGNRIDSANTKIITEFAGQLDLGPGRQLHFSVLKGPEVNAFALPDGNVFIYSAILPLIDNSSQLAALIGHEAAHVRNRHSVKLLARNLGGYLLISVMLSDVNGVMSAVMNNANSLRNLSYSRSFEEEADAGGLQMLVRNHIDPNGMKSLFEHLQSEEKFHVPVFISTHPVTERRIRNVDDFLKTHPASWTTQPKLDSLFQLIKTDDK